MSEPIQAKVNVPETTEAPGAPPVADAAPQDATLTQAVQVTDAEAQKVAEEEQRLRKAADATLADCSRAFRRGEKAYRAGLFDAGRLAQTYIQLRLKLGAKRKTAIDAIEGELAKHASSTPDANRLIRAAETYRLLTDGQEAKVADAVPYGHFRDCYASLTERVNKDSAEEAYVLLPGLETECKALFADATKAGLSKDDLVPKIQALTSARAKLVAEEASKAKEEQEAKAKEAKRVAEEAKVKEASQAEALAKAKQEADKAEGENKAALTAKMEEERAALRKAQEEAKATDAAATLEAQKVAQREKDETKAKEQAQKAEAKANGQTVPRQPVKTAEAAQGTNILATLAGMAKQGNVKDTAGVIADMVMSAKDPMELFAEVFNAVAERFAKHTDLSANDALCAVVAMAKDCDALSRQGQRAAHAALVVLSKRSSSPAELASVEIPASNGQLVKAS